MDRTNPENSTGELPEATGSTSVVPQRQCPTCLNARISSSHETTPASQNLHTHVNQSYAPPPNFAASSYQYEMERRNNNNSTLAAAITFGSALGLTAAAAVRWLNGGDFLLFPPAYIQQQASIERPIVAPQEEESSTSHQTEKLERLLECVSLQTERQETIVTRLQEALRSAEQQRSHDVTDRPMDLLKEQQRQSTVEATDPKLALGDIQAELRNIREAFSESGSDNIEVTSRLEKMIARLDSVLEGLEGKMAVSSTSGIVVEPEGLTVSGERTVVDAATTVETKKESLSIAMLGSSKALQEAIRMIVFENDLDSIRRAAQMLYLYVVNVSEHPRVPRYRKIYTSNESFQRSVANLTGASALLSAVGFVEQEKSGGTKSPCWEWLPPSIHNRHDGSDDSSQLQPSPQKAWLGDSEATYLQRLKEAAVALEILKGADSTQEDKDGLLDSALSAAGILDTLVDKVPAGQPATTPPRQSPGALFDEGECANMTPTTNPTAFKTPDTGSVLSPPATKKQSRFLSMPGAFPSLEHPLVGVAEESGSPYNDTTPVPVSEDGTPHSDDNDGPVGANDGDDAEDTVWK